jgi:phage terminase Nu1 subunit (DNA packaging protein)
MAQDSKPLSLRAYARRRGVSAEAVSKAVAAGRLRDAVVVVDGQPKIGDPELADREWEGNTRPRADKAAPAARSEGDADIPDYLESRALREAAAARREAALADEAELDLAKRRGELIDAEDARGERIEAYSLVKARLLAVPSQVAQRLPHLATEVEPVIDELIREALQELSERARSTGGG